MYQTIIQFTQYPYNLNISQTQQSPIQSLKLQTLIQSQNSTQFIKNKQKYQYIKQKCIKNTIFVKLLQIFQESLTFHLIYQYIPISIKEYIKYQISVYQDRYSSKTKDIHHGIKQNQYNYQYNNIKYNNQNNQSNNNNDNNDDNQYNIGLFQYKKQLLQYLYRQLVLLTQGLINCSIITNLEYNNIGIDKDEKNKCRIKYYLGTNFQIISSQQSPQPPFSFQSTHIPQKSSSTIKQLTQFYQSQRKKILSKLQEDLQLQKRNDGLPLYIIKSNKIIFTDQLSQTKTRKRKGQSPQRNSHLGQQEYNRYKDKYRTCDRQSQRNANKYRNWNTDTKDRNNNKMNDKSTKQKYPQSRPTSKSRKHKYSCNIQQQSLNFQFDTDDNNYNTNSNTPNNKQQDSQVYSITKTKSMKIQVQHQKPTKKNRKNSLKFKITTFQQIQIDQSVDQQGKQFQFYPQHHHYTFPKYGHHDTDGNNNMGNSNTGNNNTKDNMNNDTQQDKKDYKQKVKQAKKKAQVLLAKYMKAKNKSTFK